MKLNTEPISFTEAVRGVVLAIGAVLQAFNVWNPTPEQNATLLGLFVALSVALSAVARAKSTPTANVALTKPEEQQLLDAGVIPPDLPAKLGG